MGFRWEFRICLDSSDSGSRIQAAGISRGLYPAIASIQVFVIRSAAALTLVLSLSKASRTPS